MNKKCYTHLSHEERETLSLGLALGQTIRTMATILGRAPSTLSRETARHATKGHPYRACTAHTLAAARARQARRPRKLLDPWLWRYVRTHLVHGCSPEQIAGRLRRARAASGVAGSTWGENRSVETSLLSWFSKVAA